MAFLGKSKKNNRKESTVLIMESSHQRLEYGAMRAVLESNFRVHGKISSFQDCFEATNICGFHSPFRIRVYCSISDLAPSLCRDICACRQTTFSYFIGVCVKKTHALTLSIS